MSTARAASLGFDTLRLEGALLLPDLLEKASQGKASGQTDADYHVPRGYTPKEEIGRAFRIVQAQWKVFGRSVVRADELSSKEFSLPVGFCFPQTSVASSAPDRHVLCRICAMTARRQHWFARECDWKCIGKRYQATD